MDAFTCDVIRYPFLQPFKSFSNGITGISRLLLTLVYVVYLCSFSEVDNLTSQIMASRRLQIGE